jgi:hypothetical protein
MSQMGAWIPYFSLEFSKLTIIYFKFDRFWVFRFELSNVPLVVRRLGSLRNRLIIATLRTYLTLWIVFFAISFVS